MDNLFIVKLVVTQGLKQLAIKLPALSLFFTGPLSFVGSYFLEKLLTFLVNKTVLGVSLAVAYMEVDGEKKDYEEAITDAFLKKKNNPNLTQAEKDKLESDVIAAAKKFIHVRQVTKQERQNQASKPNLPGWDT